MKILFSDRMQPLPEGLITVTATCFVDQQYARVTGQVNGETRYEEIHTFVERQYQLDWHANSMVKRIERELVQ